jgi:hypothetical protein
VIYASGSVSGDESVILRFLQISGYSSCYWSCSDVGVYNNVKVVYDSLIILIAMSVVVPPKVVEIQTSIRQLSAGLNSSR